MNLRRPRRVLVLGGARSGKSSYAEGLLGRQRSVEYIACGAIPDGEDAEWAQRVALHRGDGGEQVPSENGAWSEFYPAFARAVRGEGPVPVEPRDAIASATVLDAARVSATEGGIVRFTG